VDLDQASGRQVVRQIAKQHGALAGQVSNGAEVERSSWGQDLARGTLTVEQEDWFVGIGAVQNG
jgi:hypothetical protein